MKFNPIELIGVLLVLGGGVWSWVTYTPDAAPDGLAVIEFGIAFLLLGALFSVLANKK